MGCWCGDRHRAQAALEPIRTAQPRRRRVRAHAVPGAAADGRRGRPAACATTSGRLCGRAERRPDRRRARARGRMPSPMSQIHLHQHGRRGRAASVRTTPRSATGAPPTPTTSMSTWTDAARTTSTSARTGSSAALAPFSTGGVYVNFLADEGGAQVRAAYGEAKYQRLPASSVSSTPATFSGSTRTSRRPTDPASPAELGPRMNAPGGVLIVTWDGGGNVPPALALGARLSRAGHRVRVLGPSTIARAAARSGLRWVPYRTVPPWPGGLRHEDDWERLMVILNGRPVIDDVLAAVEAERPGVVVVDCLMGAALAAAEHAGVPTVALVHVLYRPFADDWGHRVADAVGPRSALGLEPVDGSSVREAMGRVDRVLAPTPPDWTPPPTTCRPTSRTWDRSSTPTRRAPFGRRRAAGAQRADQPEHDPPGPARGAAAHPGGDASPARPGPVESWRCTAGRGRPRAAERRCRRLRPARRRPAEHGRGRLSRRPEHGDRGARVRRAAGVHPPRP